MAMPKPRTPAELLIHVRRTIPQARLGRDDEGQVVIYTGLWERTEIRLVARPGRPVQSAL